MAHLVEGDWKNFTFKIIGKEEFPAVSELLRTQFYTDEPISKIVGNSEAKFRDSDNFILGILDHNLSFAAYDKDTGKIAGARITFRHTKDLDISQIKFESTELKISIGLLMVVEEEANIFERYGIDEVADLLIASVHRDYRRQGLASEMYRRTFLLLKELNLIYAKSLFSSPYTRRIANTHGFKELARRNFRELQKLDGEYYCPEAGDDEFAAIMVLKL